MATRADTEPRVIHPKVTFDIRDMSPQSVFAFLLLLTCGIVIVHIVLWGVFKYMGKSQFASQQTTNPIMTSNKELGEVGGDPTLTFPLPRLQADPVADLNKFRVSEEEQLNSYGWADPAAGKIHIPIESAIDALSSSWPKDQETTTDEGAAASSQWQSPGNPRGEQLGK